MFSIIVENIIEDAYKKCIINYEHYLKTVIFKYLLLISIKSDYYFLTGDTLFIIVCSTYALFILYCLREIKFKKSSY